jgi:hypothetical protein
MINHYDNRSFDYPQIKKYTHLALSSDQYGSPDNLSFHIREDIHIIK